MSNTLLRMPKPPKKDEKKPAKPRFPSRDRVAYPAIPKLYAELLKGLTGEGEEYEGRSVSFLTKVAVRAFLQSKGLLDAKGQPTSQGGGAAST